MAYTKREYTESDAVKQARAALEQQNASKPGAYESQWQSQLDDTINQILNRKDFSFDLNGDALYQQYKDRYVNQGQMAMMDTMGQAAALTGGYGNSYAQTAGQQAYQGYLQGLNDRIPELYQLALDRYNQQGQDLYNQYSLLGSQESQDYSRYQDALDAWSAERDWLSDQYNTERGYDYGMYRDQVGDDQWQAEFDEDLRRYNQEWDAAHPTGTSTGSGGYQNTPASNPDTDTNEDNEEKNPTPEEIYKTALAHTRSSGNPTTGQGELFEAYQSGLLTSGQYALYSHTLNTDWKK